MKSVLSKHSRGWHYDLVNFEVLALLFSLYTAVSFQKQTNKHPNKRNNEEGEINMETLRLV